MEPIYHAAKAAVVAWHLAWFERHVEGTDHIPRTGPALIASNHVSYLDPLTLGAEIARVGRRPRFLAKSELFQDRRIAWVLRGAGQIEVKRGTSEAVGALDDALAALERGEVVVIFPEGTVTTTADLRPMAPKSGAGRLALHSGAPVIPTAVWGTANVWSKEARGSWRPRQEIAIRFGHPIVFEDSAQSGKDYQAANARIMDEIATLLAGLRPLIPDRRRPKRARL